MGFHRLISHLRRHIVGYLALFLVLGGVAHAALVAPDGTIKACVIQTTGATTANTRIIDEADSCSAGQTPITFNQRGPTGPQGSAGPTGPAGSSGGQGSGGTSSQVGPSSQQLGKPKGGLATKAGKSKAKIKKVRAQVGPAGGVEGGKVIIKRVFVTGVSGPLETPKVQYGNFPSIPDPYARAKTARVACPQSAPNLITFVGEGTAGAWHPDWNVTSGQYEEGGVSKAFMTVTARFQGPENPNTAPSFPGNLGAYEFEVKGECVS